MDSPLSETTIRKKLLLDALQHPMTILPSAFCILSIIYLVLLSDILGGARYAIIFSFCSIVTATSSFFWLYSIRYKNAYTKKVSEIIDLQERVQRENDHANIKHLIETIRTGFSKINLTNGSKALTDLVCEYQNLQHVIEYNKEINPLPLSHIPTLAEETFRQGLSVLSDVLEIAQVIQTSDKDRLEENLNIIESEIGSLSQHDAEGSWLKIKNATAASCKERLDMIKQQELRVDKLLYQCMRCEASLHRARVEIVALKTENSELSISAVTETLQLTINQAKEIQEELKRLGY